MGELIIMMGIPGSGKSTFTKGIMDLANDIYVSRDDIRFELLKDKDDYFSHENEVWNLFIKKIIEGLQQDKKVWADATHINKASRGKLLNAVYNKIIPDSVSIVFMNTDVKVALERNNHRGGRAHVPDDVIYSMWRGLQLPRYNEFPKWKYENIWIKEVNIPIYRMEEDNE